MKSAYSTQSDLPAAIDEVCDQIGGGPSFDAAVVFVTHEHSEKWDTLGATLGDRLGASHILGCSAEGVIGSGREQEEGPALSVLAIRWSQAAGSNHLLPIRLEFTQTREGPSFVGWPDELLDGLPSNSTLLLLADPFSFPADFLLQRFNEEQPELRVIGGMASGGAAPGSNRLFLDYQSFDSGAVAWLLDASIPCTTLVSQGCRPIGDRFVVTAAEQNQIHMLGGKPALEQLHRIYNELPTHEQALAQRGLHLGRVISEYQDHFEMGDFLIRNVMGIHQESQAIVVGDYIRPGQTVQFHLRDEQTASLELQQMLAQCDEQSPGAGLLFTCNGRGTRLFSESHHDAQQIDRRYAQLPLAGLFAQGELGPVGGRNFLHGFTASLLLVR